MTHKMRLMILLWMASVLTVGFSDKSGEMINLSDQAYYGAMWWSNGFSYEPIPAGRHVSIQTSRYGLSLDVEKATIRRFGSFLGRTKRLEEILNPTDQSIEQLPPSSMELAVVIDGKRYLCQGFPGPIPSPQYAHCPFRIIHAGRFVQRFDILDLVFRSQDGQTAPIAARLELVAWPDRLGLQLQATPQTDISEMELSIRLAGQDQIWLQEQKTFQRAAKGQNYFVWGYYKADSQDTQQTPTLSVSAATDKPLRVDYDAGLEAYTIHIPSSFYYSGRFPESIERCRINIKNPTRRARPARLVFFTSFSKEQKINLTGNIGMLTDAASCPTGLFVQISKNWHWSDNAAPQWYEGSWFYGYSEFDVPADSDTELRYQIINGVWGGAPAVSHSQLCLVGWGGHQLWEQVAIGNWGESICYDPDICLGRSFIDDMRPLMVWAMSPEPKTKWDWTNNVGGGDFLRYIDSEGNRQKLINVKTFHRANGPNLTDVVYTGISQDGAIAARFTVSTPRSDDINRSYHAFRYDILKPVSFQRLAFYQLGADGYNPNRFDRLAVGNEKGLLLEWKPALGGDRYHMKDAIVPGRLSWVSLHRTTECFKCDDNLGSKANRGMVIRYYRAQIDGKEYSAPTLGFYGMTDFGIDSATVDITPPPDVQRLSPGDWVECRLDLLVLPQYADDYYGPNAALQEALKKHQDTWTMVYREAIGNDLKIDMLSGRLVENYPILIDVGKEQKAEFAVSGGVGYAPMIFRGVPNGGKYRLAELQDGKPADIPDNRHYQLGRAPDGGYQVVYNILLDGKNGLPAKRHFLFTAEP